MNLYYKTYGAADEVLVIIHGLLGTADNWHLLAGRYASHFTVVCPDLRNHGQSPHSRDFSYDLMVEDLQELIAKLGASRVSLIGHSMGGKVAMQLALQEPLLVKQLVVADMRPQAFRRGHDHIFKALFELPLGQLQTRKQAEERLTDAGITNQGEMLFLLKNLSRDTDGKFIWKPNLDSLWEHYDRIIEPVSGQPYLGKTLFLSGGLSGYVLPEHQEGILSLFPKAQFDEIPHAGHWLHAEAPDAFFNKTMQFFSTQD